MPYLAWLEQTSISVWVRETPSLLAFPFVLFLHTLGLGIAAGLGVALCLWILALAHRYPMEPMRRFFPAAWIGFTIALVSGVLLLLAYPTKALTDPVFYLKLALIAAALYCLQWMRRRVFVDADPLVTLVPDGRLRAVAGLSIVLWLGAVLTGRLLAYTYVYLTAGDLARGP